MPPQLQAASPSPLFHIPALCCDFTKRVARSMQTIKQPVTLGSSVPLCPVFSTRSIRRIQATTSWEEGLEGLSRLMKPVLERKNCSCTTCSHVLKHIKNKLEELNRSSPQMSVICSGQSHSKMPQPPRTTDVTRKHHFQKNKKCEWCLLRVKLTWYSPRSPSSEG